MADVATEHIDAAIRIGKLDDSGLIAKRIGVLPLGLYASPAYLKKNPPPKSPDELTRHSCICLHASDTGSTWIFLGEKTARTDKPLAIKIHGRFVANNMSMVRQLTLLGAGIGILDKKNASDLADQGYLIPLLTDWKLEPVDVHLLAASRLMPARLRLFADFLAQNFQRKHSNT